MFQRSQKQPRRKRRSLTPKGARTRQALLRSAREVFEREGYAGASVSQIGRRCGVSQGTFYQYFRNKEQVFRELIDRVLQDFWDRAQGLSARDQEQALAQVAGLALEHCRRNQALHRVLNEFELIESVTISYYDSIARFFRGFFRRAAEEGRFRPLDPNVTAYSLLGMATFLQRDLGLSRDERGPGPASRLCADFLARGISGSKPWQPPEEFDPPAPALNHDNHLHWEEAGAAGKRTQRAIFQAAEQVLGQLGYSGASISEITRRAGVAQGTFYVHFKSKEELMDGVVRFLSHELRRQLRQATDRVRDRRDKEIEGMRAFYHFLGQHSQIYRIVSESEVIVPPSAAYYYGKLAAGYAASLEQGIAKEEIRDLPLDFMVACLMGISHMLGLRWLVWNSSPHPEIPPQIFVDAVELVLFGLRAGG